MLEAITINPLCTTEGICDWCKRSALLTPHHYLDGKTHHSCQECHAFATLDVRLYNIGEKAEQERRNARQRLEIQL